MKTIAVSVGLLFAMCANADAPVSAKLVGQRIVSSFPGMPVLVCQYLGPEAKYEVVASKDKCAPFFQLSSNDAELGRAAQSSVTVARTASP